MNAERTNAEELIRKLRENAYEPHVEDWQIFEWMMQSADLIESLTAQLAASQRRAQDARNELCLKCGRYRESHNGACDGCRWKE
jgi:hypothetical protein